MTPSRFLAFVRAVALTLCVFGAVAMVLYALSAHAQDVPAIKPTACGEAGVGRLVGRAEPVARSASEAAGSYVAEDGYWHTPCPLVATPDTACGAPGVGRIEGAGMLRREEPGWRVDADSMWVRCDQPCPPESTATRKTWAAGGQACTSPDADRTIDHGRAAVWLAAGSTRGVLSERCVDGVRTVEGATCEAATTCGPRVRAARAGVTYTSSLTAPAAAGTRIDLRAADGSTWPATCRAGRWDVPPIMPRARPEAPPRPAVVLGCRPGVWSSAGRYYRHDGAVAAQGQVILAQGLMGAQPATFVCDGGRWIVPPAASAPASSEPAADEWRRKFEQQQRDAKP